MTLPIRANLRRVVLLVFGCLLAACATEPPAPVELLPLEAVFAEPERPLPVLGQIEAIYDGQPVLWETLDFSLGAIDPSANVSNYDGVVSVFVGGHLPGQPFREDFGRLTIRADLPEGAVPGPAINVEIEVIDEPGAESSRYRSGADAVMQITQIVPPDRQVTVFGSIDGTFAATLCRAAGRDAPADLTDCRPLSGTFSTKGSFEGLQ